MSTLHPAAELTGGTVPPHVPGAYPRLSCCGGPVQLATRGQLLEAAGLRTFTPEDAADLLEADAAAIEPRCEYCGLPRSSHETTYTTVRGTVDELDGRPVWSSTWARCSYRDGTPDATPSDPDGLALELEAEYRKALEVQADRAAQARAGGRAAVNWYAEPITRYAAWRRRGRDVHGDPISGGDGHARAGWRFTVGAEYLEDAATSWRESARILCELDGRAEAAMIAGADRYGDPLPPIYAAGRAAIESGTPVYSYNW